MEHRDRSFGWVFSAAFFGYLFGALVFGTLSDRIGRKKTLILASCVFSVGTLLAYFSHSIQSLIPIRIFTGFGIGGAVPCAITLTSEYSPLKGRGKYVSIMYSGFLIGIVFGGYAAGAMLQHLKLALAVCRRLSGPRTGDHSRLVQTAGIRPLAFSPG